MVPGLDGVSLCRRIRDESTVPVIMLSARADSIDVVLGLEAGADDDVTKPFDGAVLVARICAARRAVSDTRAVRTEPLKRPRPSTAGCSPSVTWRSTPGHGSPQGRYAGWLATPTEMRLLLEFSSAPGTVLSRDKLLERVWDYGWGGDTRVVDVHVQRLRTKIGQDRIETVRGFRLQVEGLSRDMRGISAPDSGGRRRPDQPQQTGRRGRRARAGQRVRPGRRVWACRRARAGRRVRPGDGEQSGDRERSDRLERTCRRPGHARSSRHARQPRPTSPPRRARGHA